MADYKIKKQVCFGYDPATGKRIRRWVYGNKESDIRQRIREIERELESIRNPSDITFKNYADKWFETYKSSKSISTKYAYDLDVKKCEKIHNMRMRDIVKTDLQQIVNQNREHPETCRKLVMTLKQIFDSALDDGIISVNPALKLERPKKTVKKKRAFTKKEREAIKKAKLDPEERMFLDLLYYCGMRRGEILALTRSDFDFKSKKIKVCKSVAFKENNPVLKDTKTHVSRYVPIPDKISARWKKAIEKMPFILFSRAGSHFTKSVFRGFWKRIDAAVNLKLGGTEELRIIHVTPHMVRHDYATRLYYVPGISTKKKAEILGHSEKVFLEIYSHLDDEKEDLTIYQQAMDF